MERRGRRYDFVQCYGINHWDGTHTAQLHVHHDLWWNGATGRAGGKEKSYPRDYGVLRPAQRPHDG